ncbi:uncharacterized protein LOC128922182 [Zeugodacus cucurbitae]|uniref:uncharacterized protein LOC128922182 n=1 Tax=Zeugodacus cucurbitae TaxID=28588 RepID=UPI0023D93CC3|nr:uncharacterized protein LOC128922182 [Zeugodacus cucurbitae]
MRLSIVVATIVPLLLVFDDNVLSPVGAARRQKRLQLLKPQHHKHTSTYGRSSGNSNIEAHARSADTLDAPVAAASDSEQQNGDSGRGFMAKWMMFKSMLQPSQPPPSNNIIILSEPTYTFTTPTTTTITSPTYTYTTPTTSTATNSTRGQFTHIVYARQDNGGAHEDGVRVDSPDADAPVAPTMTNAPQLTATNAGIPLFMGTKPGMTNQIPMIGQFPRPAPQRRRNNNNRSQLNQTVRRRRIQAQRNGERNNPVNNYNKRRRRLPVVQGDGGKPLQQRPKRRKVVQIPNQIRKVNRKGNSGDSVVIVNKVDQVGVGGGNKFDTNSRLQHFMNHLRHPQLPIVQNHH